MAVRVDCRHPALHTRVGDAAQPVLRAVVQRCVDQEPPSDIAGDAAPPPRPVCPPSSGCPSMPEPQGHPLHPFAFARVCRGRRSRVHRPIAHGRSSPPVPAESRHPFTTRSASNVTSPQDISPSANAGRPGAKTSAPTGPDSRSPACTTPKRSGYGRCTGATGTRNTTATNLSTPVPKSKERRIPAKRCVRGPGRVVESRERRRVDRCRQWTGRRRGGGIVP